MFEKRKAALKAVWNDAKGQTRGGMIKTIFVGVILAVVLGMATSKIIANLPAENDVLGVISTAGSMGPTIVNSSRNNDLCWERTFHFLGPISPRHTITTHNELWGESWTNQILPCGLAKGDSYVGPRQQRSNE